MKNNLILLLLVSTIFTSSLFAQEIKHELIKINYKDDPSQVKMLSNAKFSEGGVEISVKEGKLTGERVVVPIEDASPFLTVSAILRGENIFQQQIQIVLFGSKDGITYDESYVIEVDEHVDLEAGIAFNAVFFDYRTKYIKYEVKFITGVNEVSTVYELQLNFISPGATPSERLKEIKEKGIELNNIEMDFNPDLSNPESMHYPRPPIVTRTEWGCPLGQGSAGTPSITIPTHLIVHHSAGSNSSNDWAAIVRSYYTLHTVTNGWSDIGYNWLIDAHGVIYQGRAWYQNSNDDVLGAHFCAQNSRTMGVCVMGNFVSVPPSQQAYTALVKVLAYKASQKGIDPKGISLHTGSSLTLNHVSGHSHGCNTTCPGPVLLNSLPLVRNRVFALLNPPMALTEDADSIALSSATLKGSVNPNSSITTALFDYGEGTLTTSTVPAIVGNGTVNVAISVNIDNLTPLTTYQYRVRAYNSDTSSVGMVKFFNTSLTAPTVPVAVSPANNAANVPIEYSFIWQKAEGAIYYYLQISTDSAFSNLLINDATILDTFKLVTSLAGNRLYYWRVSAQNQNGSSTFSFVNRFTTEQLVPGAIVLLLPDDGVGLDSAAVTFIWEAEGGADKYWLEISTDSLFNSAFFDSTITGTLYEYSNFGLGNYYWRVRGGNNAGWGEYSTTWKFHYIVNSIENDMVIAGYYLYQNHPNPFNPSTNIRFHMPENKFVKLMIYDMLGKEVKTLVSGEMSTGLHEVTWNGDNNSGEAVTSGTYIMNISAGSYNVSKKLLLMK